MYTPVPPPDACKGHGNADHAWPYAGWDLSAYNAGI